jgi:serine protease
MMPSLRAVLLPTALLAAAAMATAAGLAPRSALAPVAGEVIVKFRADTTIVRQHALAARAESVAVGSALAGRAATLGARVGRTLEAGAPVGERSQVVRARGVDAQTLAAQLAADAEVEYAVPNGRRRILTAPNDPLYPAAAAGVRVHGPDSGQWYLRASDGTLVSAIDIESAWARSTGSASVVVAVLDTGVRPEHPDLAGRLLAGYNFVADPIVANNGGSGRGAGATDPGDWTTAAENSDRSGDFFGCDPAGTGAAVDTPSSWHGTGTSSLIGAATDNGVGMAATAPGVTLLPVRVLGKCFGSDADILAGMRWAVGLHVDGVPDNPNPAKVLNMSLGSAGRCNAAYQSAVNDVIASGAVIVAAAGNSAGGAVGTPADCAGVIAVLALRHVGTKVGFSDLGPEIAIAAPGGNCVNTAAGSPCLYPILAATNSGAQGPVGSGWTDSDNASVGTSFAAPLVAGTAALMVSLQPSLSPAQLRTALRVTARTFPTTGGDNGDGTLVTQCLAPLLGREQLQCYCNTSVCGAGMLDAGAGVVAVADGVVARIDLLSSAPVAQSALRLDGRGSTALVDASIVGWSWTLLDGGGIVTGFDGSTSASTVSVTPTAAGSFRVRLTVSGSQGGSAAVDRTVSVAAAPVSSGGGGAASVFWVLGVLLAVVALRWTALSERRRG